MKDQVTSIEQSKRLIELGVPAEKASMVWEYWINQDFSKEPSEEVFYNLNTKANRQIDPSDRDIPAYTVADLLGILPKVIEHPRTLLYYLTIQHTSKKYSEIEYKGAYGVIWSCFGPSLLDNLVEAINWGINSRQELNI